MLLKYLDFFDPSLYSKSYKECTQELILYD